MASSPFYNPPPTPGEKLPHVEIKKSPLAPLVTKPDGPTAKELEEWYYEIDTIAHENLSRHLQERLLDLRDKIYRYMR